MNASVVTGLFVLAGVVVGALLNTFVAAVAAELKGRRALKTTARIVGEEIGTNAAAITGMVDQRIPSSASAPLLFNAWEHYRHVLAERLSNQEWELLGEAIRSMRVIEMERHRSIAQRRPLDVFDPSDSGPYRGVAAIAQAAAEMLEHHARRPPHAR
jgi:hypothetical protein